MSHYCTASTVPSVGSLTILFPPPNALPNVWLGEGFELPTPLSWLCAVPQGQQMVPKIPMLSLIALMVKRGNYYLFSSLPWTCATHGRVRNGGMIAVTLELPCSSFSICKIFVKSNVGILSSALVQHLLSLSVDQDILLIKSAGSCEVSMSY